MFETVEVASSLDEPFIDRAPSHAPSGADRAVLAVSGPLYGRAGPGVNQDLVKHVRELILDGHREVRVDLSRTSAVDAAGLGCLVKALRVAREAGVELFLVAPPDRIARVLSAVKLRDEFRILPHA